MFRLPYVGATVASPVVFAVVLRVLAGCGDDLPPAADTSSTPVPGPSATASSDAALPPNDDAGALGDGGDASSDPPCVGPALGGNLVAADLLLGPLPGDEGGTVVEGTYDLTKVELYGVPDELTDGGVLPDPVPAMRATLKVGAGAYEVTSQLDGESPMSRRASYHPDDVFLVTDGICPTTTTVSIPYTASATSLRLHTGTRRWETFTRR